MTFLEKLRVFIFAHQNRVRSMFLEFLEIVEGGTPGKRIPEGLLNRARSMFFGFFVDSRGGTPGKRISEALF